MTIIKQDNYFIDLFMEFYQVLLRVKIQAQSNKQFSELEMEKMHLQLKEVLEKQAIQISMKAGAFIYDCYREIQYALCGLADETMLFLDWVGKTWWRDHLLEHALFQTHTAGEQIFTNLDKVLESNASYKKSILISYLYLLSLGFMGKYNLQDNAQQHIIKYKEDIFFKVYNNTSLQVYQDNLLNNQIQANHMSSMIRFEKDILFLWLKRFGIGVMFYLLFSHLLWGYYIYPMSNIATSISEKISRFKKV